VEAAMVVSKEDREEEGATVLIPLLFDVQTVEKGNDNGQC
jgi:hypothetical protein